jgi:hypothetical protein
MTFPRSISPTHRSRMETSPDIDTPNDPPFDFRTHSKLADRRAHAGGSASRRTPMLPQLASSLISALIESPRAAIDTPPRARTTLA